MSPKYTFNRMELSGAFGDLGTLLPLAIGMIMLNGLSPSGMFLAIGLFYIFSGMYYGVTVPVQPMKVIGAYAIAMGLSGSQIAASGLLVAVILLVVGGTGAITLIGRYVPKPVIRGVQMATGTLLMTQGVRFVAGTSTFQLLQGAAEPYLSLQSLGGIPSGIIMGIV
ncbi:MAG: putative sulfate/molybdate transporter, partial [Desulfoplanes sp.]|nr:putative sulfate/molybdate transporter [Desulfoplanes sp.]